MRIASISMVRNEADIIEAFVRHNRQFVDRLYILNDGSTDATSTILRLLQAEGIDLVITNAAEPNFYQGVRTSRLLQSALADHAWDFVIPLDGDEFMTAPDRKSFEAELAAIPEGQVGALAQRRYLPTDQDDMTIAEPLRRIQYMQDLWPSHFKVILPFALATCGVLAPGNHFFYVNGVDIPRCVLPNSRLSHFPVRSPDQLIAKNMVQYMRTRSQDDYFEGSMSHHVMKLVRHLKIRNRLQVDSDTAMQLVSTAQYDRAGLIRFPFDTTHASVRYAHMAAEIRPYDQIVTAIDGIIEELRALRKRQ